MLQSIKKEVATMLTFHPFSGGRKGRAWFWWGINISIVLAIVVWYWLENQGKPGKEKTLARKNRFIIQMGDRTEIDPIPGPAPAQKKPEQADDLKIINGIGPRSASVLNAAGIVTFHQLAAMKPEVIKELLKTAGIRVGSVDTWPDQAARAAKG
jgi:large subunit ribosomal protein L21